MNQEDIMKAISNNYDLSTFRDIELVDAIQTLCARYNKAYYGDPTTILNVWEYILRVVAELYSRRCYGPEDETIALIKKHIEVGK